MWQDDAAGSALSTGAASSSQLEHHARCALPGGREVLADAAGGRGRLFPGDREELRGILNSGHTRDAAYVLRTVGDEHEPRRFSTWAAKAVAMIGRLADTLADRSIVIPMRRRALGEHVERLRLDRPDAFEEMRRRATRWSADNHAELRDADPEMPGDLGDRAADNWRPLLAIADLAGGEWPERARAAALALSGATQGEERASVNEQLLADVREVFSEHGAEQIFTAELLAFLCSLKERRWGDWRNGRPMTDRQLSDRLKLFGIRSRSLRDGAKTAKGYLRQHFEDAFARYLPAWEPKTDRGEQPSEPAGEGAVALLARSETVGKGAVERTDIEEWTIT